MTITREQVADLRPGDVVEWRTVPGYPDYRVCDDGRVISLRRGKAKELKGCLSKTGYRSVWLCNNEGRKQVGIHRVVLLAFIGPCPDGMEGRHLDDDSTNNGLSNLAYGTHGDNMLDQVANGGHAAASRTQCPQGHPYDDTNTLRWASGRRCRSCETARQTRRNRQEMAA